MSLRGRLSFSRNRRDVTMDKPNGGTYRNQIWFVVLGSFVLWFFLFYFNSVAFNSSKIKVQAIFYSFMSPEAISELVIENRTMNASEQASPLVDDKRDDDDGYPKHRDEKQAAVVEQNFKPFNRQVVEGNNHVSVNEIPADVEENREEPAKSMLRNGDESANDEVLLVNEDHAKKGPVNHHQVPVVENKTRLENMNEHVEEIKKVNPLRDPCSGKYIYVHNLPSRFNYDIIKECRSLNIWVDTCPTMANGGLGPRIGHSQGVFTSRGWFATDQFTLEVIFHNRMKQYKCLTDNSSLASAVFVPFYSGLDVERYLWGFNASSRDATSLDLVKWLGSRPEWKVFGGRDHFLVAGRITWDFRRMTDEDADWGNKLLNLPEGRNMSTLVIEASPWHRNDFAIPYPTYFHPSSDIEIFQWQNRMKRQKRRVLFTFAGAPRPGDLYSIRGHIISQCQASKKSCKLLDCSNKATAKLCYKPINVMKLFQSSVFCLQPSGDSFTRRSAFDSIVAGCIPVFFNPGSAYVQYIWHLPKDFTKYSVFISENDIRDGKVNIETVLSRIPKEKVIAMREEVIKLIPRVIYADPRSRLETVEDAFDIAVEGVIERVNKIRRETSAGQNSELSYREENTWKYNLYGTEEKHKWDQFFANPRK